MGFRKFLISYIALVTIPVILLLLCLRGMGFAILQFVLDIVAFGLIALIGVLVGVKLGGRVKKADPKELHREDDVLLEAVAFSQSILFVLLSLMQSEDELRRALLYGLVITTITFYSLRAWAKIKDSKKYRYYSMIAFAFLSANTVTSILKLYFNIPDELIIDIGILYSAIATSCAYIAGQVFGRRYEYKGLFSWAMP